MILPSQYYEENLYPLQNGVLRTVNNCGTQFFLTGGTALGRAYYHHRYSDDLDFFVNADPDYHEQVDTIFSKLRDDGFLLDTDRGFISRKDFVSINLRWKKDDTALKLDFVNDTVPHFGDIIKTDLFDRTDSIRNILSNKLTALFRFAAKDVADIREIALHESVDWVQIIHEARTKEAGIELSVVSEILGGIPRHEFDTIIWKDKPDWETFRQDIEKIIFDMMSCNGG
jgi:predicted nucleotidyltransferase component of viral defense system